MKKPQMRFFHYLFVLLRPVSFQSTSAVPLYGGPEQTILSFTSRVAVRSRARLDRFC